MVEYARPAADVAYINWGNHQGAPVNLWDELNGEVPDPSNFIQTIIAAPENEHYVAKLSTLADPGSDDGHVLRVQARKQTAGGERLDLTAELRQGYVDEALQDLIDGLFIAGLGEASEVYELAIEPADAALITDYENLYVRVVANQPYISQRNSALRTSAGVGCGAGDREELSFAFGASMATKTLDGGGDTWNRAETTRTIKAGTWQAILFYNSTLGTGPTNKIKVQIRVLNPDCSLKQTVMDQTVSVAKGQMGAQVLAQQSAGAVALVAGDILAVTISKVAGNQAVTLRYNGTHAQAAMSKMVDPGEDIVNSKAEVSWIELEVP